MRAGVTLGSTFTKNRQRPRAAMLPARIVLKLTIKTRQPTCSVGVRSLAIASHLKDTRYHVHVSPAVNS